MALSARLPLAVDRYGACVRTVLIRGLDLTGVTMAAQVRLRPDTPGDPLVDLDTVETASAEGLYFVSAATGEDGVTVSTVQIRINETTLEGLPYAGELGDASTFAWDWQATISGDKRRLAYGDFTVLPGVTGADDAPTDRAIGYTPKSSAATWSTAQLTFGPETVEITIDGADIASFWAAQAEASAELLASNYRQSTNLANPARTDALLAASSDQVCRTWQASGTTPLSAQAPTTAGSVAVLKRLPILPSKTYTVSVAGSVSSVIIYFGTVFLALFKADGTYLSAITSGSITVSADKRYVTFTTPSGSGSTAPAYVGVNVRDATRFSNSVPFTAAAISAIEDALVLNEGSVPLPYEEPDKLVFDPTSEIAETTIAVGTADKRAMPITPLIVDSGNLLIPPFYWISKDGSISSRKQKSSGEYFISVALPALLSTSQTWIASLAMIYADEAVLAAGGNAEDAIKTVGGVSAGGGVALGTTFKQTLFARALGAFVDGDGLPIAGDVAGGVVPNLCPYGKDADQMPRLFSGTTLTDITDASLTALGFTRGATTAATQAYFGMDFVNRPKVGQMLMARFYLQSDTDNAFGIYRAMFLWHGTTPVTIFAMQERQLSARAASYIVYFRIDRDDYDYFYVGANMAADAEKVIVTGVQYHCSNDAAWWIRRDDYPSVPAAPVETDYAARDAANIAVAQAYQNRTIASVQKPSADYNVMAIVGQSYARGFQSRWALSEANRFGNKMLGGNVLPAASDGEDYPTVGSAVWTDMVAIPIDGATVLTNETSTANAQGEPANHGWLNGSKFLLNQMLLTDNDARTFATFNAAVSGKTIEQLSKVNTQDSTDRFARLTDAMDKAVTAAGASSIVLSSFGFDQGQSDSAPGASTNRTRALYKAALGQYIDDTAAEALVRFPAQKLNPAFFIAATGQGYAYDIDADGNPDLFVAMAQLELSLERPDTFMVGPTYPYPDNGSQGHPTANGQRWYGCKLAQVQHRVQHEGRDWSPLRPIRVEKQGDAIYVDFLVPEPPLQWLACYVGATATPTTYTNKGFRVIDLDNGNATVTCTVELAGDTIVKLNLSGSYSGNLAVYYADKTVHDGNGNLADSDPFVATDSYLYDADYMGAEENITALIDKPYPMQNWAVPFFLPVGYGL